MAYIFELGTLGQRPEKPTTITPVNTYHIIDNTPTFTFNVPADPQSDRLVFCVEVSLNKDDFSNPVAAIESRMSSMLEIGGYWEYDFTGSNNFVTMPVIGVPYTLAGRKVKASFPPNKRLPPNNTYYWRVLVSDAAIDYPVYLNQFIVAQGVVGEWIGW